ncbi:MAG: ATP-dependent RecD-like DNA helicase [Microbacteriaceae bacterium]
MSSTIHRLIGSWDRGHDLPTPRTVLVVDEAGMAGIRDLVRVVAPVVAAGGRVLLVGDHHQLPEVTAGGGFAALAVDADVTVAELTVNRRQQLSWEIGALAELRDGHVARAVDAYRAHDRVVVTDDRAGLIAVGVERWLAAHHAGTVPVLLGGTNEMVDALNAAARRALIDTGILRPIADGAGGCRFAIGERLMIRVNDYHAITTTGETTAVLNGQTGALTAVRDGALVVRMDHDDSEVVLPWSFADGGGVGYAYAMTAHKAQGGTWDLAITVGLDGLYREAGYLVMSRGRQSNWLLVTRPELDQVDADLARHDSAIPLPGEQPDTIDEQLLDRLGVSRGKRLAHTRDPHAAAIHHTATTLDYPTLERWAGYSRAVEQQASQLVGGDPDRLRDRLARIEHTARHAAIGQRVKAWDRRNIGAITGLDDNAGTVQVTFVAADGRAATRAISWSDLTIVDRHPDPRVLPAEAEATLNRLTSESRSRLVEWDAHLVAHGVQPDDRHVYEHAASLAVQRAASLLTAEQPGWLTALLGARPLDRPAATQVWDDAVRQLTIHRLRHHLTDPHTPTGPDAADDTAKAVWRAASPALAAAHVWLDTHTTQPKLAIVRTRSRHELQARRAELDAIFATAPPDARALISALTTRGQLALGDTAQLLDEALAAQGERRRWILQHWPHVVEATEIADALEHGVAGPDIEPLLQALAASAHPLLASAAQESEPWLPTLVAQIVDGSATIDPAIEQLLGDVAAYRQRWVVSSPCPLGEGAVSLDQADELALLSLATDQASAAPVTAPDTRQPATLFGLEP